LLAESTYRRFGALVSLPLTTSESPYPRLKNGKPGNYGGLALAGLVFALLCTATVLVMQQCTRLDPAIVGEIDRLVLSEVGKRHPISQFSRDETRYRKSGTAGEQWGNFQYLVVIRGVRHRLFVDWRMRGSHVKLESVRFDGPTPEP
jgi:hypothetical protein